VSANFLSSKVINTLELPRFLERHSRDENFLIYPIIIKPCFWDKVPWLEKIEVKPKGGKPIWGRIQRLKRNCLKLPVRLKGLLKIVGGKLLDE
jgi:hypothetical protein